MLEKLQYHESKSVYLKTVKLLQKHFELEQELDLWFSLYKKWTFLLRFLFVKQQQKRKELFLQLKWSFIIPSIW